MRNLRILGLGMVLVLGLFVVSCGENGQDDSGSNPAISGEQNSGYDSITSEQSLTTCEVETYITSKPPKKDCDEIASFAFTCDRERTCKQLELQLQSDLPAFLKPFCACTYECKVNFNYPTAIRDGSIGPISVPEGWYNCSSPTDIYMPSPFIQATFRVRATDYCGNVDPTPAKYSWANACAVK